ncbi:MAG: PLDc N-terminal domain-containing protein [Arcobacter sp.]|jgi:hypothetical protein|uniref:PLDc N-terminal domain-containing protein n=1 Tax=unclassified Arcobacter TaxID=2593671 RepID=UPI0002295F93|nr:MULTISPECIES: PLDc N-terminal domain-containing protein [unclassified Arcobacter]MDY3201409.1 PLDc N-terminal domain-containing protein [Arcobacter sp.]BAK73420.1 hypothetical protein ABLL_1545 [Arcobacter sp. L]
MNKIINKKIKLNGKLRSSLRKKSPEVTYSNIINSGYIEVKEKYKPKILFIQIILNSLLLAIALYFEILLFIIIFALNYIIIWLYSFISIMKDTFKKRSNKLFWITLLLFVPFSAFVYPDFKKVQIVKE